MKITEKETEAGKTVEMEAFNVNTPKEANEALRLLGVREIEKARLQAKLERRINSAKEAILPEIEVIKEEQKALLNALQAFAEENKDEIFSNKRSLELNFGTIGFQKSSTLVCKAGMNWEKVLDLAKSKYPDYTKINYELLKSAIKTAPERTQSALGVRIEEKDAFYAKGKNGDKYQV